MNRSLSLFALVLLACGEDVGGTAVGNPGKLSMAVDDLPLGTQLESGSFDVAALELVGDRRRVSIVKFDEPFDLVDPTHVDFPPGDWHTAVFLPRGEEPLRLEGRQPDGAVFSYALPVEPMIFEGDITIDGDEVVVGLSVVNAVRGGDASLSEPSATFPDAEDRLRGHFGVGETLTVEGGAIATQGEVFEARAQSSRGCETAVPMGFSALLRR